MPQNDRAIGARIVFLFYVGRCLCFFPRTASGFFPLPSAYFFLCTGARPHVAIKHGVLSEARLMHFRRQSHARCLFISAALLFIFSKAYHLITTVCFVWIDCAFLSSVSGFFPDENTVCVTLFSLSASNRFAALVLRFTIHCSLHLTGAAIWPFLLEMGQQNEISFVQAFQCFCCAFFPLCLACVSSFLPN